MHINKSAHHLNDLSRGYLLVGEHRLLLDLMFAVFTVCGDLYSAERLGEVYESEKKMHFVAENWMRTF